MGNGTRVTENNSYGDRASPRPPVDRFPVRRAYALGIDLAKSNPVMKLGIVGAMKQEVALLQADLENVRQRTRGMREYLEGTLYGKDVVLVFSRWGKVAAASTVTTCMSTPRRRPSMPRGSRIPSAPSIE